MHVTEPFVWIFWDMAAVIIMFMCVYKSARRGFVSTIVGFLVYAVAAAVAGTVYARLAGFLYDKVIYGAVRHMLTRSFNQALVKGGDIVGAAGAIPLALRFLIGEDTADISNLVIDESDALAAKVISLALEDPIMSLLHTGVFLLVFALAAFFMRWLAGFFTGLGELPVIGSINTALGGVVGVLAGILSLFVLGFALRLVVTVMGGELWWLNSRVIGDTYIWRLFY